MTRFYQRKVDSNQSEIVTYLREAGYHVCLTHRLGEGFPDLLVARARSHANILVEVKQKGELLTPAEKQFFETWPGDKIIAYDGEDALRKLETLYAAVNLSARREKRIDSATKRE